MKQIIVVNNSLHLPKGKLAAQVAHAAVAAFLNAKRTEQVGWLEEGMPKVVLRVETLEELLHLNEAAAARGIAACLIEDAGRTVVPEGTVTCLGLGPAEDGVLDAVTGKLKLL